MTPHIIGGVGLTHLTVYDSQGPDGVKGGCAHVHALTDEAYFCFGGSGQVELHDLENGFRIVPLEKGSFVQFPPNTLHRSVCHEGLEILAIMGNSGLPERGDARIYFGADIDNNPEEYQRIVDLAKTGKQGALKRRDISAIAYTDLMNLWHRDRDLYRQELDRFFTCHRQNMATRKDDLIAAVTNGAAVQAEKDKRRFDALPGTGELEGSWHTIAGSLATRLGMCGMLAQIEDMKKA